MARSGLRARAASIARTFESAFEPATSSLGSCQSTSLTHGFPSEASGSSNTTPCQLSYVLPAYFDGRNLAESFYLGLAYLSWQGVVLGDPLASLGKP